MIILFPQAAKVDFNPNGCWDMGGFNEDLSKGNPWKFATKHNKMMESVM